MEGLVVAKIQTQHWLRFLTCYFALRLCNLCLVIPGALGVSHFRSPPPGPGNPPGKVNAVMRTDVRITPAY